MVNALHSHESAEHYTPVPVIEAARATLGAIDLDPFSCEFANRWVKANYYFDGSNAERDGFKAPWIVPYIHGACKVFANAPGKIEGKVGGLSRAWRTASDQLLSDRPPQAIIFVAFSVELLQTAQNSGADYHPLDFACCFPKGRLRYDQKIEDRIASREKLLVKANRAGNFSKANELQYTVSQLRKQQADGVTRVTGDSPTHSSFIVCMTLEQSITDRFHRYFGKFGVVRGG